MTPKDPVYMVTPEDPSALELLEALAAVVGQACEGDEGRLDSYASSAYAEALRLLARYRRVVIEREVGRRVIARWAR